MNIVLRSLTVLLAVVLIAGCPPANLRPIADAGPDQTVEQGSTVILDGSGSSDPEGGALSYQWQFVARPGGSMATLSGVGSVSPSFVADRPGTFTLRLTVYDSGGASASDTVSITVTGMLATVPNLPGQTVAEAEASLAGAGLTRGAITEEFSNTVPIGQIIRTSPAPGAEVDPGSSVNIVVSLGPEPDDDVDVPDLAGLTRAEAESALADAGLILGEVGFSAPGDATPGTVIGQDPAAGERADEGSAVSIIIALEPIDIQREHTINLLESTGDPAGANMARPDDARADSTTGEIFITARLTPHIAVYDTATESIARTMDSGFAHPGEKRLFLAPGDAAIYVYDVGSGVLARMDRATGAVTASAALDGPLADAVVDPGANRVYAILRTSPGLRALHAATLVEASTSTAIDGATGDAALDPAGKLLVLNTETESSDGELRTYDPASDTVETTVTFDMPGSGALTARQLELDPSGTRFFVRTDTALGIFNMNGSNGRVLPLASQYRSADMAYDPASGRLIAAVLELPALNAAARRGVALLTFNPNLGQSTAPQESFTLGEQHGALAVDTGSNFVLATDPGTGTVWTLQTSPFPPTPSVFEIGSGIGPIVAAGGRVFGGDRFANSRLFWWIPESATVDQFDAGLWPAPIHLEAAGNTLTVLNAWDSTVSRFDVSGSPVLDATIATGFSVAASERLPSLAVEPSGGRIAVAYPEFAEVAILDAATGGRLRTLAVPSFGSGAQPEGSGQLQIAFVQDAGSLFFVFDRLSRVLRRFDAGDSFTPLSTANLGGLLTGMADAPEHGWLFHDPDHGVFFVGPLEVSLTSGTATGASLPATQTVIAADTALDVYWTVTQTAISGGLEVTLNTVNRRDYSVGDVSFTLPGPLPVPPEFAFDTANRRFYVAYPHTSELEAYRY
ncbi:MAG: PASTA domain-containing protein [Candidatus Hydrogenedentes bacterium]|nr:PASTA domain-containing protein [Candidatus Hydrogenedentota bacterium]